MSFTVYKSSAGSGKTYTLVKEYLKLLIQDKSDNRYRHILAITFTNKAAAEMKERVLNALKEIGAEGDLKGTSFFLLQDIKSDLGYEEEAIRLKCSAVLTSMLHNYSDIGIGTIDKFVHKIVRTFAYDLQLPVNFAVELDAEFLLHSAIDKLMSRIGTDVELTKALIAFTERKADEEKSWNIENDLKLFSFDLLKEQNEVYLEQLKMLSLADFSSIQNHLSNVINSFEKHLAEIGDKALKVIKAENIDPADFAGGEGRGIGKFFTYLSEKRTEKYQPSATLLSNIANDKWLAAKPSNHGKSAIPACKSVLRSLFFDAQKHIDSGLKQYLLYVELSRNIYAVSILNELEKNIQEIKRENNLVHISEFGKRIAAIVVNEPVPFIYERIGERYKNYLIDEFQDTSSVQWQNFLPLIENSLATNEFNMIVGDGKQAIYRWRGGEVEQFTKLPEVYAKHKNELLLQREYALKRNFVEKQLEFNRRSKREIVEFNNSFFESITQSHEFPELLKPIYENLKQKFNESNQGGAVSFHFFISDDAGLDQSQQAKQEVLKAIHNLLKNGYRLADIALLTRKNREAVEISKFLLESGINVVSKESLLLTNSPSVSFILNCLRYLNDSDDLVSRAAMMEFLLARANASESKDLNQYFAEPNSMFSWIKDNYNLWDDMLLRNLSLYELAEELLRIFNLTNEADPYLVFLLDAIHQYSSKNNNSRADFLEWWERKKHSLSIQIPDGINAVNVLTIHKSKGLEFPVVIIPYANWTSSVNNESIWVELNDETVPGLKSALLPLSARLMDTDFAKVYEDEKAKQTVDDLNLLYVAFTRAVDALHVFSDLPSKKAGMANYYVNYLKQIGEWKENELHYHFGNSNTIAGQIVSKPKQDLMQLDEVLSTNWRAAIRLSQPSNQVWNLEEMESDTNYGNLVHTALSGINSVSDIESSLNKMMDLGLVNPSTKVELELKLQSLFKVPEIAAFFQKQYPSKAEAELILPDGKTYRPDRVVFYPEKTVVLDFKTGVESAQHRTQIRNYAGILDKMGYSAIECYLIYTSAEKIVTV